MCIQFLFRIITGAHLPVSIKCGKNLQLAYGGAGLVVHKDCTMGDNVLLSPGVVIGGRVGAEVPRIGNNVRIMPGAKVLGNIFVSDGTLIGVNAVVIQNTSQGSVWVAPLARQIDDNV
jgi:serine O-acetyltransferase